MARTKNNRSAHKHAELKDATDIHNKLFCGFVIKRINI